MELEIDTNFLLSMFNSFKSLGPYTIKEVYIYLYLL